jgi:hypothetical protein
MAKAEQIAVKIKLNFRSFALRYEYFSHQIPSSIKIVILLWRVAVALLLCGNLLLKWHKSSWCDA